MLATFDEDNIYIWCSETYTLLEQIPASASRKPNALCFCPKDPSILVVGDVGHISILDWRYVTMFTNGKDLPGRRKELFHCDIGPVGRPISPIIAVDFVICEDCIRLITCSCHAVIVWNFDSVENIFDLIHHVRMPGPICSMKICPSDGAVNISCICSQMLESVFLVVFDIEVPRKLYTEQFDTEILSVEALASENSIVVSTIDSGLYIFCLSAMVLIGEVDIELPDIRLVGTDNINNLLFGISKPYKCSPKLHVIKMGDWVVIQEIVLLPTLMNEYKIMGGYQSWPSVRLFQGTDRETTIFDCEKMEIMDKIAGRRPCLSSPQEAILL